MGIVQCPLMLRGGRGSKEGSESLLHGVCPIRPVDMKGKDEWPGHCFPNASRLEPWPVFTCVTATTVQPLQEDELAKWPCNWAYDNCPFTRCGGEG